MNLVNMQPHPVYPPVTNNSNSSSHFPYSQNTYVPPVAVDAVPPVAVDISYPTISQPAQYAIPVAKPVDPLHQKLISPSMLLTRNTAVLLRKQVALPSCHQVNPDCLSEMPLSSKNQTIYPLLGIYVAFLSTLHRRFPIVFFLFFACIVFIAIFYDPIIITVVFPIGFFVMGGIFAVVAAKSQKV